MEGEILDKVRERYNPYEKYSVAVLKENRTVGHIQREISKTDAFFIKHGGVVSRKILSAKYRNSVVAGGLEIPCLITFKAETVMIENLRSLL